MVRRMLTAGCLVAGLTAGAFAQNARMNAMAGTFTIPDMSWILGNPAYALDYKDAVQATYSSAASPVIGVKSLGDMFVLGGTYTYRAPISGVPDPAPHLILGADLGFAKAGLEGQYERTITKSKTEDVNAGGNTTITAESKDIVSIPGGRLGLNLDVDAAALAIVVGAYFPGEIVYALTENTAVSSTETTTSTRGVNLSAGLEAVVDMNGVDVTVGLTGTMGLSGMSTIESSTSIVGGATSDTSYETGSRDRALSAGLYAGALKNLENVGALVAAQVEAGINRTSTEPDVIDSTNYDPGKQATNVPYLTVRGAVEKTWNELQRLDAIILRSGLAYGVTEAISHEDGEVPGLTHMQRVKGAAVRTFNGVDLTLGFGITKGIVAFDAQLSPSAMVNSFKLVNGQFASNDFGSATLTFDFVQE